MVRTGFIGMTDTFRDNAQIAWYRGVNNDNGHPCSRSSATQPLPVQMLPSCLKRRRCFSVYIGGTAAWAPLNGYPCRSTAGLDIWIPPLYFPSHVW